MSHLGSQLRSRQSVAGWWYARRARAHGRYLREHVLVPVSRPAADDAPPASDEAA